MSEHQTEIKHKMGALVELDSAAGSRRWRLGEEELNGSEIFVILTDSCTSDEHQQDIFFRGKIYNVNTAWLYRYTAVIESAQ